MFGYLSGWARRLSQTRLARVQFSTGVTGMYGVVYDNVKRFCRISRLCTSSEQDEKYPGRGGDFHTFVASRHESNWNMWSSIIRIKAGDYFLNTYHLTTKSEQYKKGS